MSNYQGLNISGNDKYEPEQKNMTGEVQSNPQFEQNDELKLGGFDFGLSQDDWDNKNLINQVNQISQTNNKEKEFQYDFPEINNDKNANNSIPVDDKFDEFQTFQQDKNQQNEQMNNKNSFFVEQQNNQSQQMTQKRLRLQGLYKISKGKLSKKRNNQPQSQLQQLVKYNQMNFKTNTKNIYNTKNNFTFGSKNNTNQQQQQQQKDFFAFAQNSNHHKQEQKQHQEEENEFAVFDRPSLFGNKQYHSTYVQEPRDQPNSPSNLLTNTNIYQQHNQNDFQTQILLSPQSGIIGFSQQNNPVGIQIRQHNNKIFSTKFIPKDLMIMRLIISVISITMIALLYGFINCIFLVIVHDFLPGIFLIRQMIKTTKTQNKNYQTKHNYHHVDNSKTIIDMNQLSLSDQIEYSSLEQQQSYRHNQQTISLTINQYKQQLQSSIKYHKYLKYTLYISSLSMLIFILIQITQLDTFFTANYFSFSNWGHIIIISTVYIVDLWAGCKLNRKIQQVLFYQENYLRSLHQNR